MTVSTKVSPPNSLVLIADLDDVDIPQTMGGAILSSTKTCIAVGCRSEIDGPTEFKLGLAKDVDPGGEPSFQGIVKTPNHKIAIRSVLGQKILELPVPRAETKILLWLNDFHEPDKVIVGVE